MEVAEIVKVETLKSTTLTFHVEMGRAKFQFF